MVSQLNKTNPDDQKIDTDSRTLVQTMMKKKTKAIIIITVVLCMIICFAVFAGKGVPGAGKQVTLNVSLYKSLPEYDSFKRTVEECWKEKHPEVRLNFVDWDCYSETVPDDLDVFVLDAVNLDAFAQKGYLLELPEEEIQDHDDLIPSFMEGCRVNEAVYVIPQMLCTDLLYTRKDDDSLRNVHNINDLHDALGSTGLLLDKEDPGLQITMYLQALVDGTQHYTDHYPPVEEGMLSSEAVASLELIRDMHQTEAGEVPEDSSWYYYARRFAEGMGKAYIGFSEAMSVMGESVSDMDVRPFSMTDDSDIPVFYVDAAAVNSKISDEKKALAFDFLNMITGKDVMIKVLANGGNPRYLFAARYSIYDALASDYPVYAELKKAATVPDAHVFRIKPDGEADMNESKENKDLLPPLSE